MNAEESDATIGRLVRERQEIFNRALRALVVVTRVREVADELRNLAVAMEADPVSAIDTIAELKVVPNYIDVPRLLTLVQEQKDLSQQIYNYDLRLKPFGL